MQSKIPEALGQFSLEVRRTLEAANRDEVHDLRVASRRLRQAIVLFARSRGVEKIRRRLKKTITLAGAVRDYDIAAKLIAKLHAPARLQARLKRRRGEGEAALIEFLRAWRDRGCAEKWLATVSESESAAPARSHHLLMRAARRVFKRAKKIDGNTRDLHRLRIATKKLRYTMELMTSSPARLDQIKTAQSKLGDISDYETARRVIAEEGGSKRLIDNLKDKQQKKTRQFRRLWRQQFAGGEQDWMTELDRERTDPSPLQAARSRRESVATPAVRERPS